MFPARKLSNVSDALKTCVILVGALLMSFAAPTVAQDLTDGSYSEQSVRQALIDAYRNLPQVEHVSTEPDGGIFVRTSDGWEHSSYIDNLMKSLALAELQDRQSMIDGYVAALRSMIEQHGVPRRAEQLMPSIYGMRILRDYAAWLRERDGPDTETGHLFEAMTEIAGELQAVIVFDFPHQTERADDEALLELGLNHEAAERQAVENLKAISGGVTVEWEDGIGWLVLDGYYENALILQDDLWSRLAEDLGGDLVMATPSRGEVIFAAADDGKAMERLRLLARDGYKDWDHPITDELYRWTGSGWEVYGR